ncbi:hypothetical protein ACOMHN_043725 [Nucella lapillus]
MSCCQQSCQAQGGGERMGEGEEGVWGAVKQYYGQDLKSSKNCLTGVNCTKALAPHLIEALGDVHEEVANRYYGCGLVLPEAVEGCSVLDLGCGTGRDCFAISKLVGSSGSVVGVDMTEEQLAVAQKHVGYHADKFGYSQPNVQFILGHIEKLSEAGLKENMFDIVISNCVINLCPDKASVLKEAFRVLKEGGELYFSDIYTNAHLSPEIRQHRLMWGECLAGALHMEEFYRLAQQAGFSQPRFLSSTMVDTSKFADILGEAKFVSAKYRLFKLPAAAGTPCAATYLGGIVGSPDKLELDHATIFKKNQALAVDGEVAAILTSSRFCHFFSFDKSGPVTPVTTDPKGDPFKAALPARTPAH